LVSLCKIKNIFNEKAKYWDTCLFGLVFLNSCGTAKTGEIKKPETMKTVVVEPVKKEEVKEEGSIYRTWIKLFVPKMIF
jgi:hypothetical protein